MPASSKSQFRFTQGVAHGNIRKPGLSEDQAAEYVSGQSPRGLPEKMPKPNKKKRKYKTQESKWGQSGYK